jgi:integrase
LFFQNVEHLLHDLGNGVLFGEFVAFKQRIKDRLGEEMLREHFNGVILADAGIERLTESLKEFIEALPILGIGTFEQNGERRDFYELLWHTGAAQSDGACLRADDINWTTRTICFTRKKLKSRGTSIEPTLFRFSADIEAILKRRPSVGQLFPYLCTVRAGDRATEFKQRCDGLGISGVSLHCYRYAWAERALKCGFPERFAQQALGHNSKAVHRAYAKHAEVTVPSLADWEKDWQENPQRSGQLKLLPVKFRLPVVPTSQSN